MTTTADPILRDELRQRAVALKLHGLVAHWDELPVAELPWVQRLIEWEEVERRRRGLERRLSAAHIGRFKPLADFDWGWPDQCDQAAVSGFMNLNFIKETANIILVGPNGVGKSMIAQNIAHHAVMQGHSALFVNAAQMLGDLVTEERVHSALSASHPPLYEATSLPDDARVIVLRAAAAIARLTSPHPPRGW